MNISKYGLLFFLLVVIVTVSIFGGYFGYEVSGVPKGFEVQARQPGWWTNVIEFWGLGGVGDTVAFTMAAIGFLFCMATFQVDNMPVFISMVFVIMSLLTGFLIVNVIRGT